MAKLILDPVANAGPTGISRINSNFDKIEAAIENTLSRDGTLPNQLNADLDLNNNDILNVKTLQVEDITIDGGDATGILERAEQAADDAQFAAAEAEAFRDDSEQIYQDVLVAATFNPTVKRFTTSGVGPYDMEETIGLVNNLDVKIGGVLQDHNKYSILGTTFTLLNNPGNGLEMEAIIRAGVKNVFTIPDSSVGTAQLLDDAVTEAKVNDSFISFLDNRYATEQNTGSRGNINPIVRGANVIGSATYSRAYGTYRHFNGWVDFLIEVSWTGHSGSGALLITGLPILSANINSAATIYTSDFSYAGDDLQAVVLGETSEILFQTRYKNGAGSSSVPLPSSGTIRIAGSYPSDVRQTFVFMGDSVTYGVRSGVVESQTYRHKIQNALKWAVAYNRGVGGENAIEQNSRFASQVVAFAPQACSIMSGINDFYDPVSVGTFQTNLQTMVNSAISAGIKPTLLSCNATNDPVMLANYGPYLTATQTVGATVGCVYVPVYEAFINYLSVNGSTAFNALFTDGQHPNNAGHDLIVQTILATPGACLP